MAHMVEGDTREKKMGADKRKVHFKEGLWRIQSSGEARLLGSRCVSCEEVFFPRKSHSICIRCHQRNLQDIEFNPLGKVVSFTVAMQRPAGGFYHGSIPYCYGLVDLDDGVRIEAHLCGRSEQLEIGTRVKLGIKTFCEDESGNEIQIYCFEPID